LRELRKQSIRTAAHEERGKPQGTATTRRKAVRHQGFRLDLSPLAGALVSIAIGLSLVIPSSPAAVGVFETAALVVLRAYGVVRQ
jgi:hypothetical protein